MLPAPTWLPAAPLDELTAQLVRRQAPRPVDVVAGAGWHRLRSPTDLARLDPRLEGWDATRALLTARPPVTGRRVPLHHKRLQGAPAFKTEAATR